MRTPIEELVFTAVSAFDDPADRNAFLDHACKEDPELRKKVEQLLRVQAAADTFFEFQPELRRIAAPPGAVQKEELGTHIGRYRLVATIGTGGCGVVYEAEQEQPVRRSVALKLIKLGMDTEAVIARFNQERQALAQMDHPNIARVLDGGATESGRPYFVMELVEGKKLTDFCDAHRLTIRERLEVFVQVCQAVQHAHQKGVIHRDIKPSNVLVHRQDGVPAPKVIDFGIAKATSGRNGVAATVTQADQFIGTPAYMSPEQAAGGTDVDTRSDIYSLGALLYELVCGRSPFSAKRLAGCAADEIRRVIREEEPPRPSKALETTPSDERAIIAANRATDAALLRSQLASDLDWITMKALEKERARRYETANGLAMDVQRFLRGEPVAARPPSRLYLFGKLVRRNKIPFIAGTVAAFGILGGFGASTWMYFRERDAFRSAEESRRNEIRLRAEAEARSQIAQAALLLTRNQIAEADALMERIEVPVAQPSLEAASVFRGLGNWNVSQGQWEKAAERFLQLQQANQLDQSNTTVEMTHDLLGAGPALIAAGRIEEYRQFVHATLVRFGGTSDASAAEQATKNSLILPADALTLERLKPLIKVLHESIAAGGASATNDFLLPWRPLALALYEYRRGNFSEAVAWGEKSLSFADRVPPRAELTHLILAMAYARLNQPEKARAALKAGRDPVEKRLPTGLNQITDLGAYHTGVWHDWVIAYLLLTEAARVVGSE